jgi:hypothetical protein
LPLFRAYKALITLAIYFSNSYSGFNTAMIIFLFLGFIIITLIMLAAGFVLKWLSNLVSPSIASITGRNVISVERYVQTAMLLAVTLVLLFSSQKSCSYGESFHQSGERVVSVQELAYVGLGWILLIIAVSCLGVTIWRLKIAVYGPKPKDKTRKVF